LQKNAKKFCFYQKLYVYLQMHLGFVKIRDALVKSSLVFVLVGGYRLVAPKFLMSPLEEGLAIASPQIFNAELALQFSIIPQGVS
jgi:hypothetical protein